MKNMNSRPLSSEVLAGACHMTLFKQSLEQPDVTLDNILIMVGIAGAIAGTLDAVVKIFA